MFGGQLHGTVRRWAVLAVVGALAACGSPSASPSSGYQNPTSGPLPVMTSLDELTRVVSEDCTWRVLTPAEAGDFAEGDVTSFCERDYVAAGLVASRTKTPDSVESITSGPEGRPDLCTVWNFVDIMYLFWRRKGVAPATWNGAAAPDSPAAVVQGGNWQVLAPTLASATRIASATHGYLVTAADCQSSGPPTTSASTQVTGQKVVASFAPLSSAPPGGAGSTCLVAVASKGRVFESGDGRSWSAGPILGAPGAVAHGTTLWVVAGSGKLSISADGSHWQTQTISQNVNGVATDGKAFVAAGLAGAILWSPDGLTWSTVTAESSWDLRAVGYGEGRWVAVGGTSGIDSRGVIVSSDDGRTWTERYQYDAQVKPGEDAPTFDDLAWNGRRWLTVSSHTVQTAVAQWDAVGINLSSEDGKTWSASDNLPWFASAVASDGRDFLAAFGFGGNRTSSDGLTWTVVSDFSLPFGGPPGLVWDGREWIGYGDSALMFVSRDGRTWRQLPLYEGESGYSNMGMVAGIGGSCPNDA